VMAATLGDVISARIDVRQSTVQYLSRDRRIDISGRTVIEKAIESQSKRGAERTVFYGAGHKLGN
jgi:hypothetical protein